MREEFVQHSGVSIITSLSTEATTGTSWSAATPKERYTMAAQTQDHDIQRLMNNIRVVQRQEILKKMEKADNLEAMILHHCIAIYDLAKEAEEL